MGSGMPTAQTTREVVQGGGQNISDHLGLETDGKE